MIIWCAQRSGKWDNSSRVNHKEGRSWHDLACDEHCDVNTDDSIRDVINVASDLCDNRCSKTQRFVG